VQVTIDIPTAFLDSLADAVAERVVGRLEVESAKPDWMDSKQAAGYLGITRSTLHKLTSAKQIPFAQKSEGGRLYFSPSELDAWRENQITYALR
jgi:excisionase family DNA binding protein